MPTRNLSIRLDVKNATGVRKDLTGIGKDGQRALRSIEKGGPKASKGLIAVSRASQALQGSMAGVAARAGPLGVALGALGPAGLAAAAGIGALTLGARAALRGAREAVDELDEIGKTADKIGLSTTALQALRLEADKAGVATEKLDNGIAQFSKRLGELRTTGKGTLGEFLRDFNPALATTLRNTKSTEEALDIMLRTMAGLERQTDRNALSASAFGRSAGIGMTNLVRDGTVSIEEMIAAAEALGVVLDERVIRSAEDTKDELTVLSTIINSNMNRALVGLAPVLIRITSLYADLAQAIGDASDRGKETSEKGTRGLGRDLERVLSDLDAEQADLARRREQGRMTGLINIERRIETIRAVAEALLDEINRRFETANRPAGGSTDSPDPRPETEARAEANLARFIEGLRAENELMRASGLELERLTIARQEELALRQAENIARQAGRELGEDEIRRIKEQVADTLAMKKARAELTAALKRETKATRDQQALQREAKGLLAGVATETERLAALEERLTALVAAEVIELEDKNRILARTKETMASVSAENRELADGLRGIARDLRQGASAWEIFERAANRALDSILDKALDSLLGGGSGSGGLSFLGGLFDNLGLSTLFAGGPGPGAGPPVRLARGGIMTERGALPLKRYASGGIARRPQVAVFGEGAVPEAFVPVPSGRIPVEFRGGAVAGGTIVQIIDQRGQGAARPQVSRGRGPDGREIIRVLIRDEVNAGIGRGDFDRSFGTRFGATPGLAVR